ncbi:TBC domain-containing protein kinase-like protein isoform X1 [Tribolium madens]|uniref:TBC domain-containing protein kinase-like protein isoform X1 n=1 Tax=Tribolium madens TaxID=41895 RepID=UPI001CF725A6|nr:TBC domain-containing protein kinase-like protein isoform X1 [Tribolium madens]
MPVPLLKDSQMQFGAITFFAKQHKGDTCGSNGLPLTPNSIIIIGRAQILKTIKNPYLCQYLDIVRGKHERTVVVSQYCGTPLSDYITKEPFDYDDIRRFAYQILTALNYLHERKIVHRNLSTENILLQKNKDIKLFNYGLFHMTGCGQLVSFPIMQILYSAPEIYLDSPTSTHTDPKADVWSVGIVLIELILNKVLWQSLKLGQRIRKILSLVQCNTSVFERIAREHNCYDKYESVPNDLREIVEACLNIYPQNRPTCCELLANPTFQSFKSEKPVNKSQVCDPFEIFTICELYHWWQLAGGDVFQELRKQGLIRSSPPILSLPNLVTIEGTTLGQERNPATLYDPRIVQMPLDTLYQRFAHIPLNCFYPLIHSTSKIIESGVPPAYDATGLPLVIRERDPEYQFHRVILFRRLLHGYPHTKNMILKEASNDIPPLLRGEIWAALLNIKGDYERQYLRIDKETSTTTDRQIEVDIPRCHQYNELLSSAEGHKKLKRILKAWVYQNSNYVYWQGLDSLTAPFLYLNFNNEAKAFTCLSAFIPKYLHKFFLKDNSMVIQEYLAKFSQLIAFHDPRLANHLHEINFYPELFAIPWFLTVFSHVFPLYKILHLWDKLLLGDSSFPLHIGLSVLTQLRDRLLNSGFNECILLFSDLPEVDIEKCVSYSTATFQSTPKSITAREHQNGKYHPRNELDISNVSLQELNRERCPRISASDFVDLVRLDPEKILIIDIRNPIQFNRSSVVNSVNIPFSSVTFGEPSLENVGQHSTTIKNSGNKIIVVVGNEETDLELFPKFLLKCCVSKVCVLHGGFSLLSTITPSILISQSNLIN